METQIAQMLDQYETGTMTRRQLVAGLGALVALLGGSGHVHGPFSMFANGTTPVNGALFQALQITLGVERSHAP